MIVRFKLDRAALGGVALAAALVLGGSAHAATIFSDSFESPAIGQDWKVYPVDFGDWDRTSGAGIEVQSNGAVPGVSTPFGNQYVELDSDTERGGLNLGTNSSMTRTVSLTAGIYRLDWWYLPRTSSAGDNVISVFLAGGSQTLFQNPAIGTENGTRPPINDWTKISYTFSVDGLDNLYAITFAAGGTANELGGFIDQVSLTAVPVPASALLLLGGLGGLAAIRRRKKS